VRKRVLALSGGVALVAAVGLGWWMSRPPEWERFAPSDGVLPQALRERSVFPPAEALTCRPCHEAQYEEWAVSQHAHANRLVSLKQDAPAFNPRRTFVEGLLETEVFQDWKTFVVRQRAPWGTSSHAALAVIGVEPIIQYLAPFPRGRFQVINPAYDPSKREWFDVFSGEDRRPHEWGFWSNRGMNWNAQCAFCHTTDFQKNYDIATDTYASRWKAMGLSCSRCHGPMEAHLADPRAPVAKPEDAVVMSNCASCHSRREELTGAFRPGDTFHDHYRLTITDLTDTYYPDGQVRDENFEYASFIQSKMGHAGVKCLDCHNAHSGKLKLPVESNAMCMSCHTPPGTNGATPVPDPAAHSHHAAASAGNRCVECHMPRTTYMARDPRRDHGFTIPDPVLTLEHGVPNACNRCHTDQSAGWAAWWVEHWYGDKMDRPSRTRARLIARAREGDQSVVGDLLAFLSTEPNPAWRASLLMVLAPHAGRSDVAEVLMRAAGDPSPLVRSAAVSALAPLTSARHVLQSALQDPAGVVRLTAAWDLALQRQVLPPKVRAEVEVFVRNQSDQPGGVLRQAELALAEGRKTSAMSWLRKAEEWDPSSGMFLRTGYIRFGADDLDGARRSFRKAMEADRAAHDAPYALALLEAEAGNTLAARDLLKVVTDLAPRFARAHYNLGLAEASLDDLPSAASALQRAADLDPGDPAAPYALATIHLRAGDRAAAASAARRALAADPAHAESIGLLRQLGEPPAPAAR